ncbi:MAG TPA: hypothetical protein VM677_34220 [Actinokineospora sp.]|nr:hypothetical protein [Actinokineospora sp.]
MDPESDHRYNEGMGIVAIPPGTTLQFYSDAGQTLRIGNIEQAFGQLEAPWPVLTSENVTYNLSLTAETEATMTEWARVTADSVHELHTPGKGGLSDPLLLCDGTTDTCPTDPRDNAAHGCTGLLGLYTGELHWLACTGMVDPADQAVADIALGDGPSSVFLNNDPDSWDEHTATLLTSLKDILKLHRELSDEAGFVEYFNGDGFSDEEREHLLDADEDIRQTVTGS